MEPNGFVSSFNGYHPEIQIFRAAHQAIEGLQDFTKIDYGV
jgi:hypothetical protein